VDTIKLDGMVALNASMDKSASSSIIRSTLRMNGLSLSSTTPTMAVLGANQVIPTNLLDPRPLKETTGMVERKEAKVMEKEREKMERKVVVHNLEENPEIPAKVVMPNSSDVSPLCRAKYS